MDIIQCVTSWIKTLRLRQYGWHFADDISKCITLTDMFEASEPMSASVNRVIIGAGNGLVLMKFQAITWTNDDLWSVGSSGSNLDERWIKILNFSLNKLHMKILSIWQNLTKLKKRLLHLVSFRLYHQVSNIRRTLVSNKIVDHSDVVGASPVGAAPTTSSFST